MAEIRGTMGSPFHGMAEGSDPSAYWSFAPEGPDSAAYRAFVCESAIDAISLYLLNRMSARGSLPNDLYCSLSGVGNYKRVDAILADMAAIGGQAVIATDNDNAGDTCRQRYAGLPSIRPHGKDWNEDWLAAIEAGKAAR